MELLADDSLCNVILIQIFSPIFSVYFWHFGIFSLKLGDPASIKEDEMHLFILPTLNLSLKTEGKNLALKIYSQSYYTVKRKERI